MSLQPVEIVGVQQLMHALHRHFRMQLAALAEQRGNRTRVEDDMHRRFELHDVPRHRVDRCVTFEHRVLARAFEVRSVSGHRDRLLDAAIGKDRKQTAVPGIDVRRL